MTSVNRPRRPSGQFDTWPETASDLGSRLGVSERTIRRDAEFAWAADFLGVADRIAAGERITSRKHVKDLAHLLLGRVYNKALEGADLGSLEEWQRKEAAKLVRYVMKDSQLA